MSSDTTSSVSLLAKLSAGELTSEEIVRQLLERSDRLKRLNVFVHLDPDEVLAQARALDSRRRSVRCLADWRAFRWRSRTCFAWRESRQAVGAACCAGFGLRTTPR